MSRSRLQLFIAVCILSAALLYISSPFSGLSLRSKAEENDIVLSGGGSEKPNAAIIMLISPSRITQSMMAVKNIEDRFNRRLKYPYVLITEAEITPEMEEKVSYITEGRAKLAGLPKDMWGPPEGIDQRKANESIDTIGFTTGYRSMCRFFSGFFWRHPAVTSYDWLWRLDTDIEFHCDIPYDPIQRLVDENKLYGFVQMMGDSPEVQYSLAPNVSTFLHSHAHLLPPDTHLGFVWRDIPKALRGEAVNGDCTFSAVYNNFEISHRSIWESPIYQSFFEYLDEQGGFFYERWGDAPVHSFGLSMTLRKDQVLQFNDTGYQHQGWSYKCPNISRCACVTDGSSPSDFNDQVDRWFDT